VLQADSEESAANGLASDSDSQQSEQAPAAAMRKDSAKSMESRLAKPVAEQDLQRISTKNGTSISMDRLPQRPSLLGNALQQVLRLICQLCQAPQRSTCCIVESGSSCENHPRKGNLPTQGLISVV
jgi:hypothetical protein